MFTEERIVGRGFTSEAEALAPLESAFPWFKNVDRNQSDPFSTLVFTDGYGRRRICVCVRITTERFDDGYAVVLRFNRTVAFFVTWSILLILAFFAVLFLTEGNGAILVGFVIVLILGLAWRFYEIWAFTMQSVDQISLPYG